MHIAAIGSSARRAVRPAAMLVMASLGGCANSGQLLAPSASGTVQVWTGDKLTPWPAQFVSWDHPANAEAMPFSKTLWDAGYKIPEDHCFLADDAGAPTRLTVLGVWYAAGNGRAVGRIGELVPHDALAAARNNFSRVQQLYTEAVWKASGGAPSRIEAMLRDAVNQDAACLRMERLWIQRRVQMLREFKAPVRDLDGRPGVATVNGQDPRLDGIYRQGIQVLEDRSALIENTIRTYGFIAQDLSRRVAAVRGPAPAPVRPEPASRPDNAGPVHPPAPAPPPRIAVDTTPLKRESDETQAAIAKTRQYCLGKAAIECS